MVDPKAHCSLLTQLRTAKIGFNAFLYERQVPTVHSPRCACDLGAMDVRHILLTCPRWTEIREQELTTLNTTDLRKILGTTQGATAAIRFILRTKLLEQFKATPYNSYATEHRSPSVESSDTESLTSQDTERL